MVPGISVAGPFLETFFLLSSDVMSQQKHMFWIPIRTIINKAQI